MRLKLRVCLHDLLRARTIRSQLPPRRKSPSRPSRRQVGFLQTLHCSICRHESHNASDVDSDMSFSNNKASCVRNHNFLCKDNFLHSIDNGGIPSAIHFFSSSTLASLQNLIIKLVPLSMSGPWNLDQEFLPMIAVCSI